MLSILYYGLVVPKLATRMSPASGCSSVAYVACCRLLRARSKLAWDSGAKEYVKANLLGLVIALLGLVIAATSDMIVFVALNVATINLVPGRFGLDTPRRDKPF